MATTRDLNVADVDELVELLEAAGLSVGWEPAALSLPGVWLNFAGLSYNSLAGLTVKLQLIVLAQDADPRSALMLLAPLINKVVDVLAPLGGPTDDPVSGVWTLRDGSRRPGISIPFDMLTTQEPA